MGIFVTELAEQGSLVEFGILFLHRTLRVHEVRALRSAKQVDHRHILRRPVQLHEIVPVDPHRTGIRRGEIRTELVATGPLLRRVRQHHLLDGVLEGSQYRTKMQSPENDLDMMQGLVTHDLGISKRRVILGAFLVTLVHVRVEMIDQRLHPNESCDPVRPGLPALVHVDVRDEEAGNGDAVLDSSEMLAELRVHELVLEIATLADRERHPAVEETDPMPEERERLGCEVKVTECGIVRFPGLLDGRCQG